MPFPLQEEERKTATAVSVSLMMTTLAPASRQAARRERSRTHAPKKLQAPVAKAHAVPFPGRAAERRRVATREVVEPRPRVNPPQGCL